MTEPDYYKTLGITPAAELPEIRQAYRRRVRDAHPDAGGDAEEFHALQLAYENLTDPQLRLEYDAAHGNRRPARRTNRIPGRHSKSRKVKAWRIKSTIADPAATATTGTTDVMSRPWFIDIDPQHRVRYAPAVWLRATVATIATGAWLAASLTLVTTVLESPVHAALKALVVPYALLVSAAMVVISARSLRPRRPTGIAIVMATAALVAWIGDGTAIAIQLAAHLVTAAAVPWCIRRLRAAIRLRTAVRSTLREFNAFGPAGTRPSADRRTAAVLRTLLERLPAARLFVRVPVGSHRAEYTVVCGRRVALITPPIPRTAGDTGADLLPGAVHDVAQLLGGAHVRGFVVWPNLPVDRISGADAVIRHLSAPDAAGEIGRWLAGDPYTLHLPTLRRLRDRLAGANTSGMTPPRTPRSTVEV